MLHVRRSDEALIECGNWYIIILCQKRPRFIRCVLNKFGTINTNYKLARVQTLAVFVVVGFASYAIIIIYAHIHQTIIRYVYVSEFHVIRRVTQFNVLLYRF